MSNEDLESQPPRIRVRCAVTDCNASPVKVIEARKKEDRQDGGRILPQNISEFACDNHGQEVSRIVSERYPGREYRIVEAPLPRWAQLIIKRQRSYVRRRT